MKLVIDGYGKSIHKKDNQYMKRMKYLIQSGQVK